MLDSNDSGANRLVCASYPTYGKSEGVAGDEAGYLVAQAIEDLAVLRSVLV